MKNKYKALVKKQNQLSEKIEMFGDTRMKKSISKRELSLKCLNLCEIATKKQKEQLIGIMDSLI